MKKLRSPSPARNKMQLAALQPALVHLAQFLIDHGIAAGELQSTISEIFVRAAESRARMKNGRVNQSRIAAMTGFTRTEVRRLIRGDRNRSGQSEIYGARKVLEGWSRDPEFLTKDGRPRKLRLRGKSGTFLNLAKKYSADVPPRATLDELKRLKVVAVSNGYVVQQGPTDVDVRRSDHNIARLGIQLTNIIQAMGYPNAQSPTLVISEDVILDTPENSTNRIIKRRVEQNTRAFVSGLRGASSAIKNKKADIGNRKTERILVRVSVTHLSQPK